MRADPRAARGDLAQQRIERGAGLALMDRIDPYEHAIRPRQLLAHFVGEVLVIDRGLGLNANGGELLEDAVEAVVVRRRGAPGLGITAPEDRDFIDFRAGTASGHAALLAWREAQCLDGRLTGCLLRPQDDGIRSRHG